MRGLVPEGLIAATKPLNITHFTFAVHDTLMAARAFSASGNVQAHIIEVLLHDAENDRPTGRLLKNACSHGEGARNLIARAPTTCPNPFVATCVLAFDTHTPLALRPQHFWLLIGQAIGVHVAENAEALRDRLVKHKSGKEKVEIDITDQMLAGYEREHWEQCVDMFEDELRTRTKSTVVDDFGAGDFSESTRAERVAAVMTTMDVCKSYFDYSMMTMCGFPRVTLEGSLADWKLLREKALGAIHKYTLPALQSYWTPALTSVLNKLVEARAGKVDVEFWDNMVKRDGSDGSGACTWINGWVNTLFPLGAHKERNPYCVPYEGREQYRKTPGRSGAKYVRAGLAEDNFTTGLCEAPVKLDGHPLVFRAGFLGTEVCAEFKALRPCVGWFMASTRSTDSFISTRIGVQIPLLGNEPISDAEAKPAQKEAWASTRLYGPSGAGRNKEFRMGYD
jgi:hypothetical protein